MLLQIIKNSDVVDNGLWVDSPVAKLQKKIIGTDAKRIIVKGGYGVGKSLTLYGLQFLNIGRPDITIYTNLHSTVMKPKDLDEKEFLEYCFEVKYAEYLKKYLRSNHRDKMQSSSLFKDNGEIDDHVKALYRVQNTNDRTVKLDTKLIAESIEETKKLTGASRIFIVSDDFDQHLDTRVAQQTLLNKLSKFDKTIIGVNSSSLEDREQVQGLKDKGFDIVGINYSKSVGILKQIVRKRIVNPEDLALLEEIDYKSLIAITQGDLTTMLSTINTITKPEDIPNLNDTAVKILGNKGYLRADRKLFIGNK